MNKKILILVSVLLVVALVLFFSLKSSAKIEDGYFKEITLSDNNSIYNTELPSFYDTIISVGLDVSGLNGVYIVVGQLSDAAKDQFNGELKAHIRYMNGVYYLFTNIMDRNEAITVISHELVHVKQYNSGQLVYDNGEITWNGQTYDLNSLDYDNRPWEKDAFDREGDITSKITQIVY